MNKDSLWISRNHFSGELEKVIGKVRSQWREQHSIPEDATVVFVAPGNEKNEAEFTMVNAHRGVKEFQLKYSAPTSLSPNAPSADKFYTVISVDKGTPNEKWVKRYVDQKGWHGKVIFTSNEDNDHLNAMSASDLGIVYDGQMVSSAVACHLPTMILINMRMHHQFYHDLFNRWANDMIITANNNIYPELIGGEAWWGKICDTLSNWYIRPDIRYDMIRKWEGFLKDSLSYKPVDRTQHRERDVVFEDG